MKETGINKREGRTAETNCSVDDETVSLLKAVPVERETFQGAQPHSIETRRSTCIRYSDGLVECLNLQNVPCLA